MEANLPRSSGDRALTPASLSSILSLGRTAHEGSSVQMANLCQEGGQEPWPPDGYGPAAVGGVAHAALQPWRPSSYAHTHQDADRVGFAFQYPSSYAHARAQLAPYALAGRFPHPSSALPRPGVAQPQPSANQYPAANRHPTAGSHRATDRAAAYLDAESDTDGRAYPAPSAHCHGASPAASAPATGRGVGHGGRLCAWGLTAGRGLSGMGCRGWLAGFRGARHAGVVMPE